MRQAVILAGGKGTRLSAVLGNIPKPLADVGGTPLLGHQLNLLHQHAFEEVVLLVNHGATHIESWLATNPPSMPVRLIDDGIPRGTAGAVLTALSALAPEFLVMYADTLLWVDLSRFLAWHQSDTAAASLFVHPNDHPADSDLVEADDSGQILRFHPYPHPKGAWLPNLVNAALYIIRRDALLPWKEVPPPLDFAKDLFPRMLESGMLLRAYRSPEYIKDAGTAERLDVVRKAWASGAVQRSSLEHKQRAVLIDRDGTLTTDRGHITRAEDLEVYDFAGPALRRLNEMEWRTVLVSNQPVLARGETSEAEMRRIHARLDTELAQARAYLDRVYICPHHPDRGFPGEVEALKISCDCRKPAAGLIALACRDLNLDLAESWLVGDSSADLGAAQNAGTSAILVETGSGGLDGKYPYEAGFTVRDFGAAVEFILDIYPRLAELVSPLLARIEPGHDWFVGGQARSGKSTLAAALERELRRQGRLVRIVHLDRWIRSQADRAPGVLGRFDMPALETVVARAITRAQAEVEIVLPAYDRRTRRRADATHRIVLQPNEIVIWEGVVAVELARRMGFGTKSVQVESDEVARRARFACYDARRGISADASAVVFAAREQDEHVPIRALGVQAALRISLDAAFAPSFIPNRSGADA
jgi:D,D-heptose 1,7-bisphosphate phosphatase